MANCGTSSYEPGTVYLHVLDTNTKQSHHSFLYLQIIVTNYTLNKNVKIINQQRIKVAASDCTSNQVLLYIAMFAKFIFTALHVMQTRYSEENSVRPSVRHTRDP